MVGIRKLLENGDELLIQRVIDAIVIPRLIELLDNKYDDKIRYEVCWCFTNISAGNEAQVYSLTEKGIIPILIKVLDSNYDDLRHPSTQTRLAG